MENNEITLFMEVKLDIPNKRPDSLKFKQWSKCEVKIEGIKCLPSYLRVTITGCDDGQNDREVQSSEDKRCICVSIIVPGVNISLAASRTKDFSYGLFWTQYRKTCYIYFALETETSCRRHMKWIKRTIKNLELHRQIMLEQNRISRGPSMCVDPELSSRIEKVNNQLQFYENTVKSPNASRGPLPKTPNYHDGNQSGAEHRVSNISDIYEEIIENIGGQPRLSRRVSRASIASGIYEEMKPTNEFNVIDEEATDFLGAATSATSPLPPVPPLPPPRKRINTFDARSALGTIPRCNTNPESELAKKKKYKNVLDIIFGSGRAKRAESVSETQACTADDIINSITPTKPNKDIEESPRFYANETVADDQNKSKSIPAILANSKRNSFSSPDLSKINYLDDGAALSYSLSPSEDMNLSDISLNNVGLITSKDGKQTLDLLSKVADYGLNVSEKIPNNFNFSAANCSSINLIGFKGAAIPASNQKKNKILVDDLTGYCVMAPIRSKKIDKTANQKKPSEPISSGYSTGSYPSTSSSTADEPKNASKPQSTTANAEESAIYEQMLPFRTSNIEIDNGTSIQSSKNQAEDSPIPHSANKTSESISSNVADFTGNLYENLLAVKASQELEHQLPTSSLSTSTPTESPLTQPTVSNDKQVTDEEDYYQTPRKSIISVDEKIPSYYPNSCDTMRSRRHHTIASASPQQADCHTSPTAHTTGVIVASTNEKCNSASTSVGLRRLVTLKIRRERKENIYISSPQNIIDQRQNGENYATETDNKFSRKNPQTQKSTKAGALKIAEHVYTVKHNKEKNDIDDKNQNNNNNEMDVNNVTENVRDRLQTELLQFALLQKIDFKFDDATNNVADGDKSNLLDALKTPSPMGKQKQQNSVKGEPLYENLMHSYDDSSRQCKMISPAAANVTTNSKLLGMHQSCMVGVRIESDGAEADAVETPDGCNTVALGNNGLSSVKKFASLPRFKKIDFSPLRLRINNVLQRGQQQDF